MVSVPCGTMHPSTPPFNRSATAPASVCQCSTVMFSLKMEKSTSARTLHMSAISGTAATRSSADRAGCTAPVR